MMVIENEFTYGQIVYLRTDPEQLPRIVTGVVTRGQNVLYELSCGTHEGIYNTIEISEEKNVLIEQ